MRHWLFVVALVVVGPQGSVPRVMRTTGNGRAKARAMADQFRKSFDEMARQAELDELRKESRCVALKKCDPVSEYQQPHHVLKG